MWWGWAFLGALVLLDLAVQGRGRVALVAALLVLAITGVMYATAWRSRVVAGAGGITVANPLRDHWIPWTAVERVEAERALQIHCVVPPGAAKGRVVSSWAVQSSPRSAARKEYAARRAQRRGSRAGFGAQREEDVKYARLTPEVREAMNRTPAQYAAHALRERARHAQQAAARAADGPGPVLAAGAERQAAAGAPGGPQPVARWAWVSIAAMAAPIAAFLAVLLM